MAIKIERKKTAPKQNVVVYGAPMSGKSTWVTEQVNLENTLFISTDGNAIPGSVVAEVRNWDELLEAIDYAVKNEKLDTIVLDVLDDAVAYAENRGQAKLGMNGKADMKGAYNRFVNTVDELVKESVLRPLVMSDKVLYTVMHSAVNKDGVDVPTFGIYSSDAMRTLNWLKGRSGKVVKCTNFGGVFDVEIESERTYQDVKEEPKKRTTKKTEDEAAE